MAEQRLDESDTPNGHFLNESGEPVDCNGEPIKVASAKVADAKDDKPAHHKKG